MIEVPGASLLATKLHIPRPRRALVSRPRLLAEMDRGFERPLTLLVAPPGFGKTTLVAEWVARSGHPVAWLSLDPSDNDPARFWAYVIAALETLQPGIGQDALALLGAPEDAVTTEAILTALINAVTTLPEDFSFVLDDYHVIEDARIHHALAFLLSHTPDCMHLIIATRADPLLPLARLRAGDDLVEVRAADLRFSTDEAGEFFQGGMQLSLAAEQVAALAGRTEGWIAGLQLAGLALRGQRESQIPDFIAASLGTNRYLVDYLVEEVLNNLEPGVQDFLCQTAILDRLSASLCDAVTGRDDSQLLLEYLERTNLFLIPLDPEHAWYRYHTLFGDVLRKLGLQRNPDRLPDLHRRAGDWYLAHQLPREAIVHALAIPDYDRAAGLIEAASMAAVAEGAVVTIENWLRALPLEIIRDRPRLCLYAATAHTVSGDLEDVEPLLATAEAAIGPDWPPEETGDLEGQIAAIRAMLAARTGDTMSVMALSARALDCLHTNSVFMRGIASWVRGLAQAQTGQRAEADRTFAEAVTASQLTEDGSVASLSLLTFGYLELSDGRLANAERLYRRALQVLEARGQADIPLSGLISLGIAEVLRLRGHLDEAEAYLKRGLYPRPDGLSEPPVSGLISLAWLRHARGDGAAALAALDVGTGHLLPANLALLRAHQARLHLLHGNLNAAEQWARTLMLGSAQGKSDHGPGVTHHFEKVTWARLLTVRGSTREALAVLDRLPYEGPAGSRLQNIIDALLAGALAWQSFGDRDRALGALGEALALGAPEGIVRPFADEGPSLRSLLDEGLRAQAWPDPAVRKHARLILSTEGLEAPPASPGPVGSQPVDARTLSEPPFPSREKTAAADAAGSTSRARVGFGPIEAVWRESNASSGLTPPRYSDRDNATARDNSSRVRLVEPLSPRELEVLRLVAAGLGNREIAQQLVLSVGTVKSHVHNIYGKLGVQDRAGAVEQARELMLL